MELHSFGRRRTAISKASHTHRKTSGIPPRLNMKAVILLAVLAVAVARPEAPLSPRYGPPSHRNGGHSNGHRSNGLSQGYQGATAAIFSNGNGNGAASQAAAASAQLADNGVPSDEFVAPVAAIIGSLSNGARLNGGRNGLNGNGRRNGANGNGAHSNGGYSNGAGNGALSAKYGPPGYQSPAPIGAGDPLAEPASYKFSYKVEDAEAGLDFGHEEEREGDDTKGEYTVLLPDGRNMIVTYTADLDGYKPEIRFEEAKGGYSRGPQNGY